MSKQHATELYKTLLKGNAHPMSISAADLAANNLLRTIKDFGDALNHAVDDCIATTEDPDGWSKEEALEFGSRLHNEVISYFNKLTQSYLGHLHRNR